MFVKRVLQIVLAVCAFVTVHAETGSKLKVFFMDVEGGQATLFVTPAGESLLIDTGWPGNGGRDADRIVAEAKKAGLSKIDYVLITHYHDDHVGGVPQLVARIPVGTFIDHGPNRELDHGIVDHDYSAYQKVLATGSFKHMTVKPGDVLPIKGLSCDGDQCGRGVDYEAAAGSGSGEPSLPGGGNEAGGPDGERTVGGN